MPKQKPKCCGVTVFKDLSCTNARCPYGNYKAREFPGEEPDATPIEESEELDHASRDALLIKMDRERGAEWIICSRCSISFPFTVREQEFYMKKGFRAPKKCATCRAIVK